MGEALSGAHLLERSNLTWDQAKINFARCNCLCRSVVLTRSGFDPCNSLPEKALVDPSIMRYDDQLDFGVRQECFVKPLVLLKGYEYCTPFLHRDWVDFILRVPRRYRAGQYLYREILKAAYPHLFGLPAKNSFGLPLAATRWRQNLRRQRLRARAAAKRFIPWIDWAILPNANYIDFDRELRDREDLESLVYQSIQDLKKRDIVGWIDVDTIWNRHQRRRGNYADALTLLASLEIILKAGQWPSR